MSKDRLLASYALGIGKFDVVRPSPDLDGDDALDFVHLPQRAT